MLVVPGHHHEDGTQSDSEDPVLGGRRSKSNHSVQTDQSEVSQRTVESGRSVCSQRAVPAPAAGSPSVPDSLSQSPPQSHSPPNQTPVQEPPNQGPSNHGSPSQGSPSQTSQGPPEHLSQQAFIIEFFDDNPRKKRSQSFTHTPAQADSYSALKAKMERRKGSERPASVHGHLPPTQQVTVPLKTQGHGTPQRSSSLKREKTEGDVLASSSSSRAPPTRPFGSVGKKSKLVQEFAAEFLKDSDGPPSPTRDKPGPPPCRPRP